MIKTTIRKGDRGERVKFVQRLLNLYPDGIFGNETDAAVRRFQETNGLKADGIVGVGTLIRLCGFMFLPVDRTITEIIVHCTATPEGKDFTVDDIRRWHKEQGWSDIGYHYVIYRDGSIHEGRDVNLQGAHCAAKGGNVGSIGVCYIGGVEKRRKGVPYSLLKSKDTRTLRQKAALMSLLTELNDLYPGIKIYGHHDFEKSKECPSFDARSEYATLLM
jgi:N-acetylmuramoyl-L-alanine amidase